MRNRTLVTLLAAIAVGMIIISGLVPREGDSDSLSKTNDPFDSGAVIGVSLPRLATQTWVEAEDFFSEQLTDAGFTPIIQEADDKVTQQQQQLESMIESGAKVLVVAPVDGLQLSSVLENAKSAGIYVISYDRMIENTEAVDCVVQYGSIETGRKQGEALLMGLKKKYSSGPYNIELFGGGPADPNAPLFFEGAMEILQPEIDKGNLVVVSGQTDFTKCATEDWDSSKAQRRMESLLAGNYSSNTINGVLSPNDSIARAILTACEDTGHDLPVVTGLDAENESVKLVWEGKQYSTVAKPTEPMVAKTVEIIKQLQMGNGMPPSDTVTDNGMIEVPVFELMPIIVTRENIREVFAKDKDRLELLY